MGAESKAYKNMDTKAKSIGRTREKLIKIVFLLVFCAASIVQGMYSTYFVSILTTIEKLYHIPSKTAGAILAATEVGQIIGSIVVSYYGGKGSRPKWITGCMTLTAIAAMMATLPHFVFNENNQKQHLYPLSENANSNTQSLTNNGLIRNLQICDLKQTPDTSLIDSPKTNATEPVGISRHPQSHYILAIFSSSLLLIGFGSTAIMTLGIPFIDEIVSKEESPLYLGVTIGLRIFGPALGFMLGSYCIRLNIDIISPAAIISKLLPMLNNFVGNSQSDTLVNVSNTIESHQQAVSNQIWENSFAGQVHDDIGAWWLGLIIISLPLLCLSWPMYVFSNLQSHRFLDRQNIVTMDVTDEECVISNNLSSHSIASSSRQVFNDVKSEIYICSFANEGLVNPLMASYENPQINFNYKENLKLNSSFWTQCDKVKKITTMNLSDSETLSSVNLENIKTSSTNIISTSSKHTSSLFESVRILLHNKLFLLRILSGILHILPIAGFYTFLPKYLTEQYSIDASTASAISGLAGIMVVGFGAFVGGTVIRVFKIDSKKVSIWIASSALLYAVGMLIMMNLGCPENKTISYAFNDDLSCVNSCKCSKTVYNPVCKDGATYLSPCLAGCSKYAILNNTVQFNRCSCSRHAIASPTLSATYGSCAHDCKNLKWYILTFSLFTMIHASSEVGAMIFNLRSVKPSERTLAFGIISFATALFGNIPCSVIYGSVIDLTCVYWDSLTQSNGKTAESGACRAYNNEKFRYYLHGTTACVMIVAFFVDYAISRKCKKVKFYNDEENGNIVKKNDCLSPESFQIEEEEKLKINHDDQIKS